MNAFNAIALLEDMPHIPPAVQMTRRLDAMQRRQRSLDCLIPRRMRFLT
jgi:hypothetical protein